MSNAVSAYDSGPRVEWPGYGWPPDVYARVKDPGGIGEGWVVLPDGVGFLARRAVSGDALPAAEDRRGFGSVDEAIRALIGDPQ